MTVFSTSVLVMNTKYLVTFTYLSYEIIIILYDKYLKPSKYYVFITKTHGKHSIFII